MPVFQYKAYNANGRELAGEIDAAGRKDAAHKLKQEGLYPSELTAFSASKERRLPWRSSISLVELAAVTRQLATLLASGAALFDALTIVAGEEQGGALKPQLINIKDRVAEGSSLASALELHPDVFPETYTRMVEAGESTGTLDSVLARLADYLDSSAEAREKVKTALVYPAVTTAVAIGVLSFLTVFVIPKITRIFEDSEAALPLPTVVLLTTVDILRSYWPVIILVLAAAFYTLRAFIRTPYGRAVCDEAVLKLPLAGRLIMKFHLMNLARTLGSLLASGLPILKALEMTQRVVGNTAYKKILARATADVTEGAALSKSLSAGTGMQGAAGVVLIPGLLVHMIAIGEKSGKLPALLLKTAASYERDFDTTLARVLSLLTPALILVMGAVVAFIVLAILLPIFELNQIIG